MRVDLARIDRQRSIKKTDGLVELAALEMKGAKKLQGVGVSRLGAQHVAIDRAGFVEAPRAVKLRGLRQARLKLSAGLAGLSA